MGLFMSSTIAMPMLLFLVFTLTSALDMWIASYDQNHGIMSSWRTDDEVMAIYEEWLAKHGKAYNRLGEKEIRFQIFKDNLRFIDEHNSENRTYSVGLNRFADLTNEEYRSTYLGGRVPASGWAFSAIAAVEGINAIVTGYLISLSEQELMDCDYNFINKGCKGGHMDYAYEFIIENGGIDSEEDYLYVARDRMCDQLRKSAKVVSIGTYEDISPNDEKSLKMAVADQPDSVMISASDPGFQFYDSGIYTGRCGKQLDHGVTVVGYGTENHKDYWIVKNSWGGQWGEEGYIRLERNVASPKGKCGIAKEASYPIIEVTKVG